MTEIHVGGTYRLALTHFAGYGLAAILENDGERGVCVHWSDGAEPEMVVSGVARSPIEAAGAVRDHAARHAGQDSWVQQTSQVRKGGKTVEVGLFSPRIGAPEAAAAWAGLYSQRRGVVDNVSGELDWLDGLMLQALGEPAHWMFGQKQPEYDNGASRWEMKTRNRGEDFTRNRLAKLAVAVANRDPDAVLAGLTGQTVSDEVGNNALDSRSGTGFVTPQPVDNALAWCAIWGISLFRLIPRVAGRARTPCSWPTTPVHPTLMVLPITTSPITLAKLRRVLRSEALDVASFDSDNGSGKNSSSSLARVAAIETLKNESGVVGTIRFPIRKAGSVSAPERQVLEGSFELF